MKNVVRSLLGAILCVLAVGGYQTPARAQNAIQALIVTTCGTPLTTYTAGKVGAVTQDTTGKLCDSSSGGGGSGAVFGPTAAGVTSANPPVQIGGTSDGTATGTVQNLKVSGGLAFVNCSNCTGSGASAADEAAFVAGTSLLAPSGGFFQTTATSNPLTNGQQGMWQMTAQRAGFVNLRAVGGTEIGTSAAEVFVGGRGTAGSAAGGVLTVQGVASMTPILANPGTASLWGVVTQGSTTSGQSGNLVQGSVTTAAPTYTTAQTSPLSLTTAAELRVLDSQVLAAVQAAIPAGTNVIGKVSIDQTTPGTTNLVALAANQSVNVAQINGVTPLMGNGATGTGSPRVTIANDSSAIAVKGEGATGATAPTGAQLAGGTAQNAEATAVTNGQMKSIVTDLVGKLIVLPYANPENFVSGVTAAMTGTTSTSLIASPGGSLRNYLTQITCSNSHATVGTFVLVQDGSGGTTLYEGYAAAVGGGFVISFPVPLRQPTTATALFVQDVTTGANVICAGSGYKGL